MKSRAHSGRATLWPFQKAADVEVEGPTEAMFSCDIQEQAGYISASDIGRKMQNAREGLPCRLLHMVDYRMTRGNEKRGRWKTPTCFMTNTKERV